MFILNCQINKFNRKGLMSSLLDHKSKIKKVKTKFLNTKQND